MWVVLILILGFCLEHLLFAKVLLNVLEVGVLILLFIADHLFNNTSDALVYRQTRR